MCVRRGPEHTEQALWSHLLSETKLPTHPLIFADAYFSKLLFAFPSCISSQSRNFVLRGHYLYYHAKRKKGNGDKPEDDGEDDTDASTDESLNKAGNATPEAPHTPESERKTTGDTEEVPALALLDGIGASINLLELFRCSRKGRILSLQLAAGTFEVRASTAEKAKDWEEVVIQ